VPVEMTVTVWIMFSDGILTRLLVYPL